MNHLPPEASDAERLAVCIDERDRLRAINAELRAMLIEVHDTLSQKYSPSYDDRLWLDKMQKLIDME